MRMFGLIVVVAVSTALVVVPAPVRAQSDEPAATVTFRAATLAALDTRAQAGEVPSMVLLGLYHAAPPRPDDAVPRRIAEARRWYGAAAATGDVGATTALGLLFQREGDAARAAEQFAKAAARGDTAAMVALSALYDSGAVAAPDATRSLQLLKTAAQGGDAAAAREVGFRHETGRGATKDPVEAAHWYRLSAEAGNPLAMLAMAGLLTRGQGLAKDPQRAFDWVRRAAEAGYGLAMYQLGTFYLEGSEAAAKNPVEARRWFEAAARAGEAEGMFGMCLVHHDGHGGPADPDVAADWMIRALRAGSVQAAAMLLRRPWAFSQPFRVALQRRLREAGLYDGALDGKLGSGARQAIGAVSGRDLR